jgi:anti-sigma factor RsiW
MRSNRHPTDDLSAYLDAELLPAERERVETHLASCERCRRELAELRQTVALLKKLPPVTAPRSFAIESPTVAPPTPIRFYSPRFYALRQATGALAALFVCVLALTLVTGAAQQLAPAGARQPEAAARPTEAARTAGVTAAQSGAAIRAGAPGAADTASSSNAAAPAAPASAVRAAPAPGATRAAAVSAPGFAQAPRTATTPIPVAPAPGTGPPPGQAAQPAGSSPQVESPTPTTFGARPTAPPGAPLALVYLAWGLGVGLVAAAAAWGVVWLRERR